MKKILCLLLLIASTNSFAKILVLDMFSNLQEYGTLLNSDSEDCGGVIESVTFEKKLNLKNRYKNHPAVIVRLKNEPWNCRGLLFTSPDLEEGKKLKAQIGKTLTLNKFVKSRLKSDKGFHLATVIKYSIK